MRSTLYPSVVSPLHSQIVLAHTGALLKTSCKISPVALHLLELIKSQSGFSLQSRSDVDPCVFPALVCIFLALFRVDQFKITLDITTLDLSAITEVFFIAVEDL